VRCAGNGWTIGGSPRSPSQNRTLPSRCSTRMSIGRVTLSDLYIVASVVAAISSGLDSRVAASLGWLAHGRAVVRETFYLTIVIFSGFKYESHRNRPSINNLRQDIFSVSGMFCKDRLANWAVRIQSMTSDGPRASLALSAKNANCRHNVCQSSNDCMFGAGKFAMEY
jgi:hypothetical protein